MPEAFHLFYDLCEEDELPDDFASLIARLQSDGENWRRSIPSARGIERFVTMLQATDVASPSQDVAPNRMRFFEFDDQKIAPAMQTKASRSGKPTSRGNAWRRSPLAPAAALLLVVLSAFIFTSRLRTPAWDANRSDQQTSQFTPIPATNPQNITLQQFSIVGAGDIWAAGFIPANPPVSERGIIARYVNGSWAIADDVSFPGVQLTQIQMRSDSEGWAVGTLTANDATSSVLYHFVRGRWQQIPIPGADSRKVLATLQATGAGDVWALEIVVPPGAATGKSVLLHYTGGTWQSTPAPVAFSDFRMVDDHRGWFQCNFAIWRYDDGHFAPSYAVASDGSYVALSGASASAGAWGVRGYDPNVDHAQAGILKALHTDLIHFDGTAWAAIPEPANLLPAPGYYIQHYYARTAQDGWAQLSEIPTGATPVDPLTERRYLLHYQNGDWSLVPTPAEIDIQTVQMTSASDGWAIGLSVTDPQHAFTKSSRLYLPRPALPGSHIPLPVVLRYQNSVWSIIVGG